MDHLNIVEPGCVGTIVGGFVCLLLEPPPPLFFFLGLT
jgi:hypothetical protein